MTIRITPLAQSVKAHSPIKLTRTNSAIMRRYFMQKGNTRL